MPISESNKLYFRSINLIVDCFIKAQCFFFSSFDFPPDVQGLKARLACVTVTARRELLRDVNARRNF